MVNWPRFDFFIETRWNVRNRLGFSNLTLVRWATGNQLPTQTKPYNTLAPLERRDIQIQTGYTGRRVTNSRVQFLGTQGGQVFFSFDMRS